MEFPDLPLDVRRKLLHENRRYSLNKEYNEDPELQFLKELRCLDEISQKEIKNAINNGISFLSYEENLDNSYIVSLSSKNEELPTNN